MPQRIVQGRSSTLWDHNDTEVEEGQQGIVMQLGRGLTKRFMLWQGSGITMLAAFALRPFRHQVLCFPDIRKASDNEWKHASARSAGRCQRPGAEPE